MTPVRHVTLVISVLALGIASAGCSGGGGPADPPPPGAGVSSPTATEAPCGAVADTVDRHLGSDQVRVVTVEGQCTTVVVATTLGDGDTDPARQLCDRAGEVAYSGDVNSVRVLSGSGSELANGITGMRCLT